VATQQEIETAILHLLARRGEHKTVCPSEVARHLSRDDWRGLMQPVRDAAAMLARRGQIEILQRGVTIDPAAIHGPIRLRIGTD
jgi:hypothetical protein